MTKGQMLDDMSSIEISERLALDRIRQREREEEARKAKHKRGRRR